MIDSQVGAARLGACTRRIAAASPGLKAPALPPVESSTLLGADPPRNDANHRSASYASPERVPLAVEREIDVMRGSINRATTSAAAFSAMIAVALMNMTPRMSGRS